MAADSRADGLDVEVVLASNVLQPRGGSGGGGPDEQQIRTMVSAFEELEGVTFTRVTGSTVEVSCDVGALDEVAGALEAVRRDQPDVGGAVPVTVELDVDQVIELETTGDPDLLDLAGRLTERDDVSVLNIRTRRADQDPPKPPGDTDAFVAVELRSDDLADAVQQVSAVFAGSDVSARSLSVAVTAVDAEGRMPSASLRVDRRGDAWEPSSLGRGTPETIDLALRAWRAGSRP